LILPGNLIQDRIIKMKTFDVLKGKVFGHPVHMMLVHFPAALFPFSAAVSLAALIYSSSELALFNFYIICTGTIMGWLALVFGLIELMQILDQKRTLRTVLMHGGLNTLWLCIFTIIAGVQLKYYPEVPVPAVIQVIIEFIVVTVMIYSNYLGGELVLKYGIGKKPNEQS
jgi:uncharacterized membrane protein